MFSLAAFKYRSVFTAEGGPIERVTAMAMPVLGRAYHQANAFLKSGLVPVARHAVYGEANGTGSSEDPQVAAHMAIPEAAGTMGVSRHLQRRRPGEIRLRLRLQFKRHGGLSGPLQIHGPEKGIPRGIGTVCTHRLVGWPARGHA